MLRMCVALPTRPDLDECIPQCTEACLTRLYNDAATFVRHHHAHAQFDSQMFEDAWALALYTDESPIYRLVNGNLSVHGRVAHEMGCVAPLIKRIYAAA
ncbi:Hypothetical protein, putative [Bodo saltans]|uniref:Uncharacterized protein n=1 Tax=Bodo saltans TaxID=75058 RepID=A0A0S4J7T6_BODSA|nr:Hypothetical protein, putative [Bodo saltans]|eukprot:CUG86554.1 Hypothetical protein, putative [Bodo saltans]